MKITLRGCNGKKREIPLEELIEIEKVFAGYPEFTHTFFTRAIKHLHLRAS